VQQIAVLQIIIQEQPERAAMAVVAEPVEKVVDFQVVIMLLPDLQEVDLPAQELITGLAQLGLRELPVGMEIMEQTVLLVTMVQQVQTDPQVPI
jgi:hypothetical protein